MNTDATQVHLVAVGDHSQEARRTGLR